MYYNNQNRPKTAVYGCSSTTLIISLIIIAFVFGGSLFIILRYFSLILVLGAVIWFFRKFIIKDGNQTKSSGEPTSKSWSRDYEKNQDTSYDNIEREFEEVDEED